MKSPSPCGVGNRMAKRVFMAAATVSASRCGASDDDDEDPLQDLLLFLWRASVEVVRQMPRDTPTFGGEMPTRCRDQSRGPEPGWGSLP